MISFSRDVKPGAIKAQREHSDGGCNGLSFTSNLRMLNRKSTDGYSEHLFVKEVFEWL